MNPNDPAFPSAYKLSKMAGGGVAMTSPITSDGMSLRCWMATQILAGMMAENDSMASQEQLAKASVKQADALLEALGREGEK